MKKIYMIILTAVFCLIGMMSVAAAPDVVASDTSGNTYGLVVVTNPPNQKASTFDSAYIISGYGKEGTVITLYWHDATDNVYKKVYNETQYIDEHGQTQKAYSEASATIGASGLFMNTVNLAQGGNNLLVYAANGNKLQLVKLSVTKYNYNLFGIIKSLTT